MHGLLEDHEYESDSSLSQEASGAVVKAKRAHQLLQNKRPCTLMEYPYAARIWRSNHTQPRAFSAHMVCRKAQTVALEAQEAARGVVRVEEAMAVAFVG
jgi:hypothetical protein